MIERGEVEDQVRAAAREAEWADPGWDDRPTERELRAEDDEGPRFALTVEEAREHRMDELDIHWPRAGEQ